MKKVVVLCGAVCAAVAVVSPGDAAVWVKKLTMTGSYNYDAGAGSYLWRMGVESRFDRRGAANNLYLGLRVRYGETTNINETDETKKTTANADEISPYVLYIRDLDSRTYLSLYSAYSCKTTLFTLKKPEIVDGVGTGRVIPEAFGERSFMEAAVSAARKLSLFWRAEIGIKWQNGTNPDGWDGQRVVSNNWSTLWLTEKISLVDRNLGRYAKLTWGLTWQQDMQDFSHMYYLSDIVFNYKLGSRVSIAATVTTGKDSNSDSLYRRESVDLLFDVFRQ